MKREDERIGRKSDEEQRTGQILTEQRRGEMGRERPFTHIVPTSVTALQKQFSVVHVPLQLFLNFHCVEGVSPSANDKHVFEY